MLRVAGSNVRMPRSHRMISELPRCATYSAACSHSSIVIASPRFSITGLLVRPTSFSSSKFCALRVPTRMQSATSATCCHLRDVDDLDDDRQPGVAAALLRISSPRSPSPWNEYGEVRGL